MVLSRFVYDDDCYSFHHVLPVILCPLSCFFHLVLMFLHLVVGSKAT